MVAYVLSAEARLAAQVAENIYGQSAEQRVHDLRRSILGDEAGPAPGQVAGLGYWLPAEPGSTMVYPSIMELRK